MGPDAGPSLGERSALSISEAGRMRTLHKQHRGTQGPSRSGAGWNTALGCSAWQTPSREDPLQTKQVELWAQGMTQSVAAPARCPGKGPEAA